MAGNDEYTVSLLHCDGADTSTTFTDDGIGGSAHTWTARGGAQLDTAQKKFGTASAQFLTATSDYIDTPDSNDFYFGADPFTLDCWWRLDNPETFGPIYLHETDANNFVEFYYHDASSILAFLVRVAAAPTAYYSKAWTPSVTTWYHLAIERITTTVQFYINGVAQNPTENTAIGASEVPNFTGNAAWGKQDNNLTPFNGHMDEMRISKGIARYQGNFTPPTTEYSEELADGSFFMLF